MKKIKLIFAAILFSHVTMAQIITLEPEEFSAVEPVTITVDVTGTGVEGIEPLYIWAWIPGCCDSPTNGVWDNSNDANQMTKVSENVWSFSVTSLRDFYQRSPGEIGEQIGFLVKADNGNNGQTSDNLLPVQPPRFVDTDFRTFPNNFAKEDVVTIVYNQNLDENEETNALSQYFLYATATLTDGTLIEPFTQAEVGVTPELELIDQGNGTFELTLIPERFFDIEDEAVISNISFVIRSKDDPEIALSPRIRNPLIAK